MRLGVTSRKTQAVKLIFMYKSVNGLVPTYISDLIPPSVGEISTYTLRNQNYISVAFGVCSGSALFAHYTLGGLQTELGQKSYENTNVYIGLERQSSIYVELVSMMLYIERIERKLANVSLRCSHIPNEHPSHDTVQLYAMHVMLEKACSVRSTNFNNGRNKMTADNCLYTHCKNYCKVTGNWMPMHLPLLFTRTLIRLHHTYFDLRLLCSPT